MSARAVAADLAGLEHNLALHDALHFASRAEALDFLDCHIIDRLAGTTQAPGSDVQALHRRAGQLKQQLEAVDTVLFARLRAEIRAGRYQGTAFRAMVETYVGRVARPADARSEAGYDMLDVFTNGLFPLPVPPQETAARHPDMVHYQKTPARVIFALAERAAFAREDVFVDVGAGLGHVALLVHLLSGVPAQGIEIEPAYCALATGWATDLGLPQVTFVEADARFADYARGTVFFLYTLLAAACWRKCWSACGPKRTAGPFGSSPTGRARWPWPGSLGCAAPPRRQLSATGWRSLSAECAAFGRARAPRRPYL